MPRDPTSHPPHSPHLQVAKQLHDSVDSQSFDDERRQLAWLINAFVRKISFGNDYEEHLSFFVDCRASFANLDAVKDTLVLGVARLAMRVHAVVRGAHSKRTAAFAKACVAYAFITIPSIDSQILRLRLNLLCAQVALTCRLLPQMDGCIKEAIKLVPDILAADADADGAGRAAALGREESLVGLLSSLCSFLVVVPGHPDHGPFYLATGLLNVIQSAPWRSPASQPTLYVRVLSLFATYAQQRLPYRVAGVDSNDVLYAAEPDYAGQVKAMAAQIVASALKGIEAGDGGDMNARRQLAGAALALFDVVVSSITRDAEISALAARLYAIAAKGVEKPVLRAAVRRVAGLSHKGKAYKDLADALK